MSQLKSKQVSRIIAARTKVSGVAVTASTTSVVITTPITSALAVAGDGSTSVPLVVSNGVTSAGMIVAAPSNLTLVYDNASKQKIKTTTNFEVYGRITQSSGVYTLSFYYINASGAETAYMFPANQTIDFSFGYRFLFHQLPADALLSEVEVYQDAKGGGSTPIFEILQVTSLNVVTGLSNTPSDVTKTELIINGQTVDALGGSPSFTVTSGTVITWSASNAGYSLETTDRVVAVYFI